MDELVARAKPMADTEVEQYVRGCYSCSLILTSLNLGKGGRQYVLCQKIIAGCLPHLDAVPSSLAMDVVSQMSYELDLELRRLNAGTLPAYRGIYVEKRLRIWSRIVSESVIDPSWDPDDRKNDVPMAVAPLGSKYPLGIPPEQVAEPEIRREYERRIAANFAKAERNHQQRQARGERDDWRKRLSRDLEHIYRLAPVTNENLEALQALLRRQVLDEKLRKELFESVRGVAGKGNEVERFDPSKEVSRRNMVGWLLPSEADVAHGKKIHELTIPAAPGAVVVRGRNGSSAVSLLQAVAKEFASKDKVQIAYDDYAAFGRFCDGDRPYHVLIQEGPITPHDKMCWDCGFPAGTPQPEAFPLGHLQVVLAKNGVRTFFSQSIR